MPPAISDDEASDAGEVSVPLLSTRVKKPIASLKEEDNDDDDTLGAIKGDINNGDNEQEDEEDEGDAEDLEEDEFIVEKILAHMVGPDGTLKFKVKWEGYEKKSDQTWEDDDNLRENASEVLKEYLESVGGRDKILEDSKSATKTKKRGRPSAGGTPTNGAKRRRNGSHPASETPPTTGRAWKPPVGSWEDEVEAIDACHDEATGKLVVYLTWRNGHKTHHDTKAVYQRCPQKMLQFYERHVKIVTSSGDTKTEL
ncbi:heterochromatin protein one [Hypomontagnella submonticulosa]|nr:heterochromatin protein one [Hypomontagnella submonticulosa]